MHYITTRNNGIWCAKKCRFEKRKQISIPWTLPPLPRFLCPPPPPVDKPWLHHRHWRSYNGGTRAHAPPPIDRSKKMGKGGSKGLVYATSHNRPLIMTFNVQKRPFWYTKFPKNLPIVGGGHPLPTPPPSGRFAPSQWPPLTNPGYTTVTGIAKGHKSFCPLVEK